VVVSDRVSEVEFWKFSKIINIDIGRHNKVDFYVLFCVAHFSK